MLGEHGQWLKNILWEESNRTPLIIRVPGARGNGRESSRIVELLDLYPTLLDHAGLPRYARIRARAWCRCSPAPTIPAGSSPPYCRCAAGAACELICGVIPSGKNGRLGAELYDHRNDPREHRNLAASPRHAAIVARLRAMLPKGKVEARPPVMRDDAIRDCMLARATTGGQPGGGEGGAALRYCETLDP